jgi:small subunit ribosomal protein S2e
MVPAPRGTGIVAAKVPKKVLVFAGIHDVYTSSCGSTRTLGNFVKATISALAATYSYLSPDLWAESDLSTIPPYQAFTDFLKDSKVQAIEK